MVDDGPGGLLPRDGGIPGAARSLLRRDAGRRGLVRLRGARHASAADGAAPLGRVPRRRLGLLAAQRPWILPCAAGYAFYVAASHLVWSEVSPKGAGWPAGLALAVVLAVPGVLLLRAHQRRKRAAENAGVG